MNGSGVLYGLLLVIVCAFGLGAVLFVQPGPESTQRLALFFGLIGVAATALVAAVKATEAANKLNGGFDDRVRNAVTAAQGERRLHDSNDVDGDALAEHPDDPGPAGAPIA